MAVAFDAVGPSGGAGVGFTTSPGTWTHVNGGNGILVGVTIFTGGSNTVTGVTYGGVTVPFLGFVASGGGTLGGIAFYGLVGPTCPTGSNTVSVAVSDPANNHNAGSVSVSGAGSLGTPVTNTVSGSATGTITINGTTTGGLLVSVACQGSGSAFSATAPNVLRWTHLGTSNSAADNGAGGTDPSTGGGANQTVTWTCVSSDNWGLAAVEVLPPAPGPATPPPAPQLPPGWFPGAQAVTVDPGGIPFYAQPQPTDATPAVIIPATPEAAPVRPPLLPPGWFPGADRVTTEPGGIPFAQQPAPADPSQAILPPAAPDILGIADWLPLPPNWFPGSTQVTTDPGSIPFYSLPQPLTPPLPPPPPPTITGLGGTGAGYFKDQNGNPRMVLGDAVWALPGNAGRWNSGNWRADFDTYLASRAAQGFTVVYAKPIGTVQSGNIDSNGSTFDGLYPFQGASPVTGVAAANPSTGLTELFWQRIDYFLTAALARGVTVFLNAIGYSSDFDSGPGPLAGKSGAEFQAYGVSLGARYATQLNLVWMVADDYFGDNDGLITSFLTGLRSTSDTHAISIENYPESDSRRDITAGTATPWGVTNAQFNFCYSYNVTYYAVEKAYAEASPIPVITGDGYFYQGTSVYAGGSGAFAYDRAIRQDAWHSISSGARGIVHGSESTWQWQSTALAASSTDWYFANNAGNIRTLMESLTGWHLLVPDTGSALVTAGRGTHASGFTSGGGGGQYEVSFADSYVSASRTPDGSLAVIYLSHGTTITVDQTKLGVGYAAYWADPVTGTKTLTTSGPTYNSTAQGNNSQGDPDWVLVLQGPPVAAGGAAQAPVIPLPPGWFPGADSLVTAVPGGIPFLVPPAPDPGITAPAAPAATAAPVQHPAIPRRVAARAAWRGNAVPGQQPKPAAGGLVKRRSAARGLWRGTVTATTNLLNGNQPGGLVRRRTAARAVWGGQSTPQPHVPGTVQPRATVPLPRRYPSRVIWRGQSTPQPHVPGQVQPRATVSVPRRSAARAVWAGQSTPQPHIAGTVQPWPAIPVPRRRPARVLWQAVLGVLNAHGPSGAVQPWPTVPVPRRASERVLWRSGTGPANAHGPSGTVQPKPVVARRAAARAVWAGTVVRTVNGAASPPVNGTVQPKPVVARRAAARAVVAGVITRTVNAIPAPSAVTGGLVRRRAPARGVWGGQSTAQPHVPGQAQPRATLQVPRRAAARASWRAILGTLNASGPAGTVQPRAAVPVPRRTAARVLWHSGAGLANAHGPSGAVQPHLVVARRTAARAVTRGTVTSTANAAPSPPVAGTVQPAASAPHRTRAPQRVLWRGTAVPAAQPQPATGGLVKRRSTARGLWHGAAGAPPPAAAPGTTATGGRVTTRRPPSRGQWHGTTVRTSNALPVAVPAPRQRLTVPRRTAARAVWAGTPLVAVNASQMILFTPGRARHPWTTGSARQQWTAGHARQQWSTGRARN